MKCTEGRQQKKRKTDFCPSALPQRALLNRHGSSCSGDLDRHLPWPPPTHSQTLTYTPEIPGTKLDAQDTKVDQSHTVTTLGPGC